MSSGGAAGLEHLDVRPLSHERVARLRAAHGQGTRWA
jgi:hypothetical protein